jgi:hypothetical protein
MVQDTSPSPEMYLSKLEGNKCGGWGITGDAAGKDVDYLYADLRECTIIWAVSVPGENQWYREELNGTTISWGGKCTTRHSKIFL